MKKTGIPKTSKWSDRVFQVFNYTFFVLFTLICVYPFYYVLIYSFSDPQEAATKLITFLPVAPTLLNYIQLLATEGILHAFVVSLARTILGTALTVLATGLYAFVLLQPNLRFRKFFYRATIVSMYLNAGIIPWYLTMLKYGLQNNFLLYIIPGTINAYFMILIKTYMESIPKSLEESAVLDGAGTFTVYFKNIFPVCMPVFAAVAVYGAVGQWNSWFDNFMLVDAPSLNTLQNALLTVLKRSDSLVQSIRNGSNQMTDPALIQQAQRVTPMGLKMTMSMIVTVPVLFVYPFLQKYFIKGIMLGAVKE